MADSKNVSIVVLDKGFIVVGEVERLGGRVLINRAVFVRRWGTQRGLGQLAEDPSLGVLDLGGSIDAPAHSEVFALAVDAKVWEAYLMPVKK